MSAFFADVPLISIIIPVYNVALYLREALDSVINQTYRNLEILVINDGSTDESGMICEEYEKRDQRIHVIIQENQGLSATRNVGLKIATGDYIAFLDSDDVFHTDAINILYEALIQTNADIAVCNYSSFQEEINNTRLLNTTKISREELLKPKETMTCLVDGKINWTVWNKLYKKSLWDNTQFPAGYNYEDIYTIPKILSIAKKIVLVPNDLVMHRVREGSITQTVSIKNVFDNFRARDNFERFVKTNIPTLFCEDQYIRIHEKNLNIKIIQWTQIAHLEEAEELRIKILKSSKQESCGLKTKVACKMLRFCPRLLCCVIPVHRFFRNTMNLIVGR